MINPKDVITMKIPFPSISDKLAVSSHMYICRRHDGATYEYVKCQTKKPCMLYKSPISNYLDEQPNIQRNPFINPTRIDCDKLFFTKSAQYDDKLKTNKRNDVCDDLFNQIQRKLSTTSITYIHINEAELASINPLISVLKN
ncbi:hypothetical protein UREOM_0440 [Ureaplasma sp. OM1]|uniref:Uncharacterized protein n=2 Tax=Ureaplasma ceti TaxID=3119530 RepID=A0ABP9U4N6_9BACT